MGSISQGALAGAATQAGKDGSRADVVGCRAAPCLPP